jgi:hypothetical protein
MAFENRGLEAMTPAVALSEAVVSGSSFLDRVAFKARLFTENSLRAALEESLMSTSESES